jgi:hypothetical protein
LTGTEGSTWVGIAEDVVLYDWRSSQVQALLRDILRPSQATRYCLFKAGEGKPGGRDILRPSQATQYCLFKAGEREERTAGLAKGASKKHLQIMP